MPRHGIACNVSNLNNTLQDKQRRFWGPDSALGPPVFNLCVWRAVPSCLGLGSTVVELELKSLSRYSVIHAGAPEATYLLIDE